MRFFPSALFIGLASAAEERLFELVCDSAYLVQAEKSAELTSERCVEICRTYCNYVDTPGKISGCLHTNNGAGCAFKSVKPILRQPEHICARSNLVGLHFKDMQPYVAPFSVSLYVTGVTLTADCAPKGELTLRLADDLDCSFNATEQATWSSAPYTFIEHKSTMKVDATEYLSNFPASGQFALIVKLPQCATSIGDEATLSVATKQWGVLNLRSGKRSNWLSSLWPF